MTTYRVSFVHAQDGPQERWPPSAFVELPLDELRPVRQPPNTHYQPFRPTLFWFSTADKQVTTRSRMAESALRELDFDRDVVDVLAEPFVLHANERTLKGRTPDFLAVLRGGRRTVVDVVSERRLQQKTARLHVARMRDFCESCRWSYRLFNEPEPVRLKSLRWLADYRAHEMYNDDIAHRLIEAARQRLPLTDLACAAGEPWETLPVLFHLLWRRDLAVELDRPMSGTTIVWSNGDE
jgi:hypothetical protein